MIAPFPTSRQRRPRAHSWSRALVRETTVSVSDLIWPIFLCDGTNTREDIASMPGVSRLSVDLAVRAAKDCIDLGIPAMALFPATPNALRSDSGNEALNPDNLINTALRAIKDAVGDQLGLIADVALDPYTSHGQDGLVEGGLIVNDATVDILIQQAALQAQSGADIIAPSDMMDGRVAAIRASLDQAGHQSTQIMAYSAKYASAFYGPFRDAVGSGGILKGDKKTYQMDPANTAEALREVEQDLMEGADSVMVKPGLPYLDIIKSVKDTFNVPTFAYQVSGEYAMLMAAEDRGWLSGDATMLESLLAFKRAGADGVLTYFAPRIAKLLGG